MNKTSSVVSLVVILVIAIGAYFFPKFSPSKVVGPTGPQGPQGERGLQGPAGRDGVTKVVNQSVPASPILGSVTGPDSYFDYVANNDVQKWSYRSNFRNATTTPCSFRSPGATTTISFATLQVNVGTSTATTWTIATSTIQNATTTSLTSVALATTLQGNATYRGLTGTGQISPNTYITWGVAGTAIGSDTVLRGTCQAEVLRF